MLRVLRGAFLTSAVKTLHFTSDFQSFQNLKNKTIEPPKNGRRGLRREQYLLSLGINRILDDRYGKA